MKKATKKSHSKKDKKKELKQPAWPIVLTAIFWIIETLLTGCQSSAATNHTASGNTVSDTGFVMAIPGNYDSADYAICVKQDLEKGTFQFANMETGKLYTLNYDGATTYEDAYGQGLAAAQISPGMLTYITFMKTQKRLNSLALLPESFHYDGITDYVIEGKNLWIGDTYYTIDEHAAVLSPGGAVALSELARVDTLTFYGRGKIVYSIFVNTGHAYLELTGDSFFEGGFLEVSNRQIEKITSGMCIAVPAGTYEVTVSAKGCSGTEKLAFVEGEVTKWDISGYEAVGRDSMVSFEVKPDEARIYIDGDLVDTENAVKLTFGLHHMIAVCDGYATISDYIKINQEHQSVEVTMDKKEAETVSENETEKEQTVSENTVSGNTVSGNTVSGNTVSGNETQKSASENEAERLREAAEEAARKNGNGEK